MEVKQSDSLEFLKLKALNRIEIADLRHETNDNDKIIKDKPKVAENNERR